MPKVSVIIPVYNVEKYLKECIDSVINQTIGFENVELVLINDGSPDNSDKICIEYKERYPNNVIYYYQENAGVCTARNVGKKLASGEYIIFLDSDDTLSLDALQKGTKMLDSNQNIDLVAFRLKYFEAKTNYHMLDDKFSGDRVVDIFKEPSSILIHMSTALVRKSVLQDLEFDSRVKISEDTKLLYEIILKKAKYGIISSSCYNYRRRWDESSAVQTSNKKKHWYVETIKYVQKYLIDLSIQRFGCVIKYVQFFIMYDLQWRLKAGINIDLNEDERKEYKKNIEYLLSYIDDDVIIEQKHISKYYKLLAFNLKYGDKFSEKLSIKKGSLFIGPTELGNLENKIKELEINNNKLLIIGEIVYIGDVLLFAQQGKAYTELTNVSRNNFDNDFNVPLRMHTYIEEIPLCNSNEINFHIKTDCGVIALENKFIHYSRLCNNTGSYCFEKNILLRRKTDKLATICYEINPSRIKRAKLWLSYMNVVRKKGDWKTFLIRALYYLSKPFLRKDIWLFCDREFMAGDSGEIMFKYFNNHNDKRKRAAYFVVDKNSADFKRMKTYGKVVSYHTLKYQLLFLHSKYIISSHADNYVNNAFGKNKRFYIDLYRFKYIYLTHGILLHDSSKWLNRINKNIALNVTTSPLEYESIINGPYYFKKSELIKTGMPRYDSYYDMAVKEENKILFMPSWRSTLTGPTIQGTQKHMYNPRFVESEYFQFYKRLLNDELLLNKLREKNLKIKFCIHPSFRAQKVDFKGNDCVEFAIDCNSQYETLSSKCVVTDYSSAACDFAYLGKPVIYANFDLDHIWDVHYYNKGYFDYDRDGFGPNCTSYDETLQALLDLIDSQFVVKDVYKKRMENFFFYRDNKNAERVYKKILELEVNDK